MHPKKNSDAASPVLQNYNWDVESSFKNLMLGINKQ